MSGTNFIHAPKWCGSREGYVFKRGASGIGYYRDGVPEECPANKRPRVGAATEALGKNTLPPPNKPATYNKPATPLKKKIQILWKWLLDCGATGLDRLEPRLSMTADGYGVFARVDIGGTSSPTIGHLPEKCTLTGLKAAQSDVGERFRQIHDMAKCSEEFILFVWMAMGKVRMNMHLDPGTHDSHYLHCSNRMMSRTHFFRICKAYQSHAMQLRGPRV